MQKGSVIHIKARHPDGWRAKRLAKHGHLWVVEDIDYYADSIEIRGFDCRSIATGHSEWFTYTYVEELIGEADVQGG